MTNPSAKRQVVHVRASETERSTWAEAAKVRHMATIPEWARVVVDSREPSEGHSQGHKTSRVGISCTPEQKQEWEEKAKQAGWDDVAPMVRDMLNAAAAEILDGQQGDANDGKRAAPIHDGVSPPTGQDLRGNPRHDHRPDQGHNVCPVRRIR